MLAAAGLGEIKHHRLHRAYLWIYCTTSLKPVKAVVFDCAESRGGRHSGQFLGQWRGTLVCDDYSGDKALFRLGVTEAGCMAHARRRFHQLWANHKSQIAEQALPLFGRLYEIEREVRNLDEGQRRAIRRQRSRPAAQRQRVPDGSETAKAIEYSLGRWPEQLAVCRQPSRRQTGCGGDAPDSFGAAQ